MKSVEVAEAARTTIRSNKKKGLRRKNSFSNGPRLILGHHLYVSVRDFGYHFGDDCELYFSLFDAKANKFITLVYFL